MFKVHPMKLLRLNDIGQLICLYVIFKVCENLGLSFWGEANPRDKKVNLQLLNYEKLNKFIMFIIKFIIIKRRIYLIE